MRLGLLDRRATLQHRVRTPNEHREDVITYATYATVWAGKVDLRGREFFAAQQVNAEATVKITVRYRGDIVPTDRIVLDGLNFNVLHVAEIPRRRGIEVLATAPVT